MYVGQTEYYVMSDTMRVIRAYICRVRTIMSIERVAQN